MENTAKEQQELSGTLRPQNKRLKHVMIIALAISSVAIIVLIAIESMPPPCFDSSSGPMETLKSVDRDTGLYTHTFHVASQNKRMQICDILIVTTSAVFVERTPFVDDTKVFISYQTAPPIESEFDVKYEKMTPATIQQGLVDVDSATSMKVNALVLWDFPNLNIDLDKPRELPFEFIFPTDYEYAGEYLIKFYVDNKELEVIKLIIS